MGNGGQVRPTPSVEVLAIPSTLVWSVVTHRRFPRAFRDVVRMLLMCCARTDVLVDDVIFVLLRMVQMYDFRINAPRL